LPELILFSVRAQQNNATFAHVVGSTGSIDSGNGAGSHYPLGLIKITRRPQQEHFRHFSVPCALGLQQAHFCQL
jgi:hypothetical protein